MRPPYGDIDDRVRNICKQLNLTPIIWTSLGANDNYDTNDWRIGAGEVSAATVVQNFEYILNNASQLDTGYIVLEHDLYKQSVELAVDVVLPAALSHEPKQTLEPIVQCLNLELGDSCTARNDRLGLVADLQFKTKGYFSGTYNAISGKVRRTTTNTDRGEISGKWSSVMEYKPVKVCNASSHKDALKQDCFRVRNVYYLM